MANRMPRWNQIIWSDDEINFLKENYESMTNRELAKTLNVSLTAARTKLYELGFRRFEPEYWNDEQIRVLKEKYIIWGDVEIAEYFNKHFPKKKGWTLKHIEKKRKYLKLNRSKEQLKNIHQRNKQQGRFSINHYKRWLGREREVGTIVIWDVSGYPTPHIKVDKKKYNKKRFPNIRYASIHYVKLSHYIWMNEFGDIPKGNNIVHKDEDSMNCLPENLMCLTNAEKAKYQSRLTDKRIATILSYGQPELRKKILKSGQHLIEIKRQQLELKKEIQNA